MGYGAGIAGCVEEMENLFNGKTRFRKLEPTIDCEEPYLVRSLQEIYKVTEDFEEALEKLEVFGESIEKPMKMRLDEESQTIEYDRNIEGIEFEEEKKNG